MRAESGDTDERLERSDQSRLPPAPGGTGQQAGVVMDARQETAVSTDSPPAASSESSSPPVSSWLALIAKAIEEWGRTLRLVVLAVTAALCVTCVAYVVQLHPDRWRSVLAAATPVIVWVGAKQISDGGSSGPGANG
jgi:hypothetical protein